MASHTDNGVGNPFGRSPREGRDAAGPSGRSPREGRGAAGPSGRSPRGFAAAGTPSGTSDAAPNSPHASSPNPDIEEQNPAAIDPELVDDLGEELEMRGDVVSDELEAARAEAAECREMAARAQAEMANTRKRLETSHADALLRAGERVVSNILPVIDDLDRAIDHAVADGSDMADGIEAVRRKLLDVLAREGASVIDPFGEKFDPNRHQAIQTKEDPEVPDHTVVEVYQKGYEMHGRVIRPAMVVVSTGGPAGE